MTAPSTPASITDLNREQRRGFKPDRKRYRLRFEGDDLDGLLVVMRGLGVGEFFDLAEAAADADFNSKAIRRDNVVQMRRLFELIAAGIVEWNLLDDDDQLVPPTVEGLMAQELDLVTTIAEQWMNAMAGVSGPLDRPSTAGVPSEVASLPMEPLSANQAS